MAAARAHGCLDTFDHEHDEADQTRDEQYYFEGTTPPWTMLLPWAGIPAHSCAALAIWILGRVMDYTPRE